MTKHMLSWFLRVRMIVSEQVSSWIIRKPVLTIVFMAAAECAAIIWITSVYLTS